MGYHPRIETSNVATFQTTRARNSELWFVNNASLEEAILGYAAKYIKRYSVKLYAFAIEGNHNQFPALFPKGNRAHFMRDLNSSIARAVPRHTPSYPGGRLWQRRYSAEYLPGPEDVEEWFFYTVLQAVQDGHVEKISQWPYYNCFHDAVHGIKRTFKVMNWAAYNDKKRYCENVNQKDFIEEVTLEYERLPGYEALSQKEYAKLMNEKLEARRIAILEKRRSEGKRSSSGGHLGSVKPGSVPIRTKRSTYKSHRPRVLCVCATRRAKFKKWYFDLYSLYKEASALYRTGEESQFPPGTYKPPKFTRVYELAADSL